MVGGLSFYRRVVQGVGVVEGMKRIHGDPMIAAGGEQKRS